MPSAAYKLIGGAFAHMTAPFAVHPNDRKRAEAYLQAALDAQLTWADAEGDSRAYLNEQGCTLDFIDKEVERARRMLKPLLK